MYNNIPQKARTLDNFAKACGIVVSSGAFSIEELQKHFLNSDLVANLIDGRYLPYSDSSYVAMALCMAHEAGKGADAIALVTGTALAPLSWDPFGFWLGKTELEVAMDLRKSISELRSIVSAERLRELFVAYHVFYDARAIESEQYKGVESDG